VIVFFLVRSFFFSFFFCLHACRFTRHHSPVAAANAAAAAYPYDVPHASFLNGLPNFNFLRKRPSDFGWDWGYAVGAMGVWRPLSIVSFDEVSPVERTVCLPDSASLTPPPGGHC
jgi:hypothetical protein